MSTMQALVLKRKGDPPEVCAHPVPVPGQGEALVRIHAAALNRRDLWIVQGQYPGISPPVVLGSDGVGTVELCATDRTLEGQRVVICPSLDWGPYEPVQGRDYTILGNPADGTFAEFITVPAENLVRCPAHLSDVEAAAFPLAGLTAWRGLVTRGQLGPGDRVLITGIGGGVATMAMVLSLGFGVEVWVTSSSQEKLDGIQKRFGVQGIRYDQEGWAARAKGEAGGFDLVFDGAGGDGFGELVRLLNPAARLVFYGGTSGRWPRILPQHLFFKQVSILASTMGSPREFGALVDFVGAQEIRPVVDEVFALTDASLAMAHLQGGTQLGKVVLQVRPD